MTHNTQEIQNTVERSHKVFRYSELAKIAYLFLKKRPSNILPYRRRTSFVCLCKYDTSFQYSFEQDEHVSDFSVEIVTSGNQFMSQPSVLLCPTIIILPFFPILNPHISFSVY